MPRAHSLRWVAVLTLVLAVPTFADDQKKPDPVKPDPLSSYDKFERQGFRIMVSQRVVQTGVALRDFDRHMARMVQAIPDGHKSLLRGVTFWIQPEGSHALKAGLIDHPLAAYYVPLGEASLRDHHVLAEQLGGIVVHADIVLTEPWSNENVDVKSRNELLGIYEKAVPSLLLHELAHAAHEQVLGFNNPEVKRAYAQAMERNLYDHVGPAFQFLGKKMRLGGRAYAAKDQLEYFAELSTGYLNRNCYTFPFTREELREHDPVGYALMQSIWSTTEFTLSNEMGYPLTLSWVGDNGRRHKLFDLMPKQERKFAGWSGLKLVGENMISDDEYRFERPKAGEPIWRLTEKSKIEK